MRDEHQARLGAQIARLRERQGWSQRSLAAWVGIDQSAVSRIESGRRRLSADELQRFAEALHVSADDLLRTTYDVSAPGPPGAAASHALSFGAGEPSLADRAPAPPVHQELRFDDDPDDTPDLDDVVAVRSEMLFAPPRLRRSAAMEGSLGSPIPPAELAPLDEQAVVDLQSLPLSVDAGSAPALPRLPGEVAGVARDWFGLRRLAGAEEPAPPWSTGHSAEGKPERVAHSAQSLRAGAPAGDVLYDRVARFWRSELHVDPDDGPLPDLVPLIEDGYGAQVIVARVPVSGAAAAGRAATDTAAEPPDAGAPATERPVAAAFTSGGVPFIFINAARPVVLQRFALAHAFAHLVLGHGDVVDRRIGWSRTIPPEAAANDFAEELLAPARAVQRWYERRSIARWVRLEDLLELGNAFGISAWAALYRSRAAGRLQGKQFSVLRTELDRHEWELLPHQAYLGGLRDTLAHLTPDEVLPPGEYGGPAVLRVPAPMRAWALAAVQGGLLSLEDAAAALRVAPDALAEQLARLGLE